MTRIFRGILLAAGILAITGGTANAQAIGQIFGKVTDSSKAVVPGVTVTVAGPALQAPLTNVTTVTGAYSFPSVPIGKFTVTFELSGFKKVTRPNVEIVSGFNAQIDVTLEVGAVSTELTITGASPVVDTKKTNTGGTFTKEILENIPTARDPWQIIGMTPGVQAGLNVGGAQSGQQVGLSVFGTSSNVQWNLEGGSITDLSSNSSPSYFNFDSFEQIQVVTGGGDVSIQSSGLSINLVTKSGSNVFKGTAVTTFENASMQSQNVTQQLFYAGSNGFLSGNPIQKITNNSVEYGGPIKRNRIWWWAAADKQDINTGVLNFFDQSLGSFCAGLVAAQKAGTLSGSITYANLKQVQKCLTNDKTVIKDLEWKFNFQLNASNKLQYLFTSDNKYRNHRGASANTDKDATTQQTSDKPLGLPLPTYSITHTMILTDRLVFNNQFTYVHGGFFLDYQDVPPQGTCLQTRYLGPATGVGPKGTDPSEYMIGTRANPACFFNTQSLSNRTTGLSSRSLNGTYQTTRHSWEAKTDGTYFLTNMLGGDHSLKFGVGWRRNPIQTFTHYSGGARVTMQCVGNNQANCGGGVIVPAGSAAGLVPFRAVLSRDQILNNTWHTWNGYLQDSYSKGRLRLNGGVRYDWQTSKYLGGCVPSNILVPDLLPAQCEAVTNLSSVLDPATGLTLKNTDGTDVKRPIQAFSNLAPRVSATYDLFGNGKTSVHTSFSYYYATKITLANALGGLFTTTSLTWGDNQSNGLCSTTAGTPCYTDANNDSKVTRDELVGTGTSSSSRFNAVTGVLTPAGNIVDKSAQIGRTREFITGVSHELVPNLALSVDYIYRNYDRGTTGYTIGTQPGARACAPGEVILTPPSCFPLSSLYVPASPNYTDPVTGITAPYFVVCTGCQRPSGVGSITMTSLSYSVYKGLTISANKRFSNRWQMNASLTKQTSPGFSPLGSYTNPTGLEFTNGISSLVRYLVKISGAVSLPYGLTLSTNINVNDGANRTLSINGPGNVYGGVNTAGANTTIGGTNTLTFQKTGTTRLGATKLVDVGLAKVIPFRGGKDRLKLMLDMFNIFNSNVILGFSSNTLSSSSFNSPSSIIGPRVFRVGMQLAF